jgi:hypothetical protein
LKLWHFNWMISLEAIVSTINVAVPRHDRSIIRPEEIAARQTASCFGRAALVGAALLEAGTPPDALSLLISEAHGVRRASGKHWFGHSELVLDTEDQSALVLTARGVALGDLSTTNWQRGVPPQDQEIITGVSSLPTESTALDMSSDAMAYLGGLVDPDILTARERYRAFPFADGIAHYQTTHPAFSAEPLAEIADYAALYAHLTQTGR